MLEQLRLMPRVGADVGFGIRVEVETSHHRRGAWGRVREQWGASGSVGPQFGSDLFSEGQSSL